MLSADELADEFEYEHLVMETDTRLAVVDGAPAGYAYTYHLPSDVREERFDADDEVLGRREAWIDSLGTLPEWRGRGVASALIVQSLHAFRDAGLSHASIGVDSDSPTGAARLYRSLGFEPQRRSVTYELAVT